jgi:glycerol uptake facilitator-like aquaporin
MIEQTGAPVQTWLQRHLAIVLGAFALVLLGAFACIAALLMQLNDTKDDLNRVEAGAALYASQVTGFQSQLSELAPEVSAGLEVAIAGLETFGASSIDFNVPVDPALFVKPKA